MILMASKKIGITGHNGFLGSHIKNIINYKSQNYQIVDFKRKFFHDGLSMSNFVNECDVIIHLAGLNRHNTPEEITKVNVQLAKTLSTALVSNNFKGSLIYSSSLQIYNDSVYGKSKKKAGEILAEAASNGRFSFINLILPNIFGPFGKPNYNSFISTFSDNLIRGKSPKIIKDEKVPLVYSESAAIHILNQIDKDGIHKIDISQENVKKVSEVLYQLKDFYKTYFKRGIIPKLENNFEVQLFNTFRSALDHSKHFPKPHNLNLDERGYFSELIRSNSQSQVSYSVTRPGIIRGNHFHTRKIERFTVVQGEALIQMRRIGTKEQFDYMLSGEAPSYVDIPIWTTHNITNTGKKDLITIFWINEHYDPEDADVYYEKV